MKNNYTYAPLSMSVWHPSNKVFPHLLCNMLFVLSGSVLLLERNFSLSLMIALGIIQFIYI